MGTETPHDREPHRMIRAFEIAELVLYGGVAVFLVIIAVISLIGELESIRTYLYENAAIIGLEQLFNTIIILELLMTVVGYLKSRSISLGLLLGAGLTAMIRKIITVGYTPVAAQDFALILLAMVILVAAFVFIGDKKVHT